MPLAVSEQEIDQLTIQERLDLIGILWDSIPDTLEALPIPEWHHHELERRIAEADAHPEAAIPWQQVKARLQEPS
jgi:putative addiction module component (TIGR02574 family)